MLDPIIIAFERLKQEGHAFETSLGYTMRPCLSISLQMKLNVFNTKYEKIMERCL
jgi:hypothetical protein